MMNIFSFRAECQHDVDEFRKAIQVPSMPIILFREVALEMGEVGVELKTPDTLEQIREVMRKQPDSHVMIQTLRQLPLEENNLRRDRDIS